MYTMIVLGGWFLLPSSPVGGGGVLDEIDTCINCTVTCNMHVNVILKIKVNIFLYPSGLLGRLFSHRREENLLQKFKKTLGNGFE